MRIVLSALLVCAFGCDDGTTAAESADGSVDAGAFDAAEPDGAVADAAADSAADSGLLDAVVPDAAADSAADMASPDAGFPPFETITLPLAEAQVAGGHPVGDGVLLDPGDSVEWALPEDFERFAVAIDAVMWRVEDGQISITTDTTHAGQLLGDGDGGLRVVRAPLTGEGTGYGAEHRPVVQRFSGGTVRVTAVGGTLRIRGAALVDPDFVPDPAGSLVPADDSDPLASTDGDWGAYLTAHIAEAPEGPVTVRIPPGTHTLTTPITVQRDNVWLLGSEGTHLVWDPQAAGHSAAIHFGGPGLGASAPVRGAIEEGQRVFEVDAPADWQPRWVKIDGDDYGPIPAACVNGRDVETYQRHQSQLAEVLALEPLEGGFRVVLDRPFNEALPVEANPRLVAARLIVGGGVAGLDLTTNCPEAMADTFEQANCSNPNVIDDNGIRFQWTDGAVVEGVSASGFGKFAIYLNQTLRARVRDYFMSHPAAYGGGGQGYGVHLVGASRTVVRDIIVQQARHGAVIDFGSSDSQVLSSAFERMNQAFVDVHGEASRDSLIMDNVFTGGSMSVIVGGGGLEVHCNDGPRHHVIGNVMRQNQLAALVVFKESRDVFARYNTFAQNRVDLSVALGAGPIYLRRNHISETTGRVTLAVPPVAELSFVDNHFSTACTQDAVVAEGLNLPVTFEANQLCP